MTARDDKSRSILIDELRREILRLDRQILREIEFQDNPEWDMSNPFRSPEYHVEREQIARRERSQRLADLRELEIELNRCKPARPSGGSDVIWLGSDEARRNLVHALSPTFIMRVHEDDLESKLRFCFSLLGESGVASEEIADGRIVWRKELSSLLFLIKELIAAEYLPTLTDRETATYICDCFWWNRKGKAFNFESAYTYAKRMGNRPRHATRIKQIIDGI